MIQNNGLPKRRPELNLAAAQVALRDTNALDRNAMGEEVRLRRD